MQNFSSSSSALYVDVLHTDGSLNGNSMFSLGTRQLMGDIDFFPNNGDRQPGCDREPVRELLEGRGLVMSMRHLMTCDHRRSVDLLARYLEEKSTKECLPMAYKCKSWEDYENGKCFECGPNAENCAIVGEPKANVRKEHEDTNTRYPYYIKTTANSPMCAWQYRIEFVMMQSIPATRLVIGITDRNGVTALGQTREREWIANQNYSLVIASETKVRDIESVTIGAEGIINRLNLLGVQFSHAMVTPMNEWSDQVKRQLSLRVCNFVTTATRELNSC
jgi:hypothetical protein